MQAELLDVVASGLLVWQPDERGAADDPNSALRLLYINRVACQWLSLRAEASVGQTMRELFPTASPERAATILEVAAHRQPHDFGATTWIGAGASSVLVRAVPVGEHAVAVVIDEQDALRRAETEATRLNRFLDSIIENMPAMVFMKEAETLRFERFNRAGEELLGISHELLLGKSDYDLFPANQAEFFVTKDREVLRSGVVDIPEEPIQTKHGERWLHTRKIPLLDEDGVPRHLLGVSIDITDKKRVQDLLRASHQELELRVQHTEEQLRHAQKMEAVGRLAGGVAHDFNNLLSVIQSVSTLALDAMSDPAEMRRDLAEIQLAAERAGRLTRQLLAFGRRQLLEPRVVDLNEILLGSREILVRMIGEDIELSYVPAPALGKVKVDVGQLEQVVLNLAVNARDAMPRGGRLTIETANVVFDAGYGETHPDVNPGPHVMLAVSDTGVGMDRPTLERVFEPFFTTKEQGKGTGLGLSTVFGIVKQSGGSIFAYSELGRGATFKLYFPRAEERRVPSETRMAAVRLEATGETVLVAEDDDQVRAIVLRVLARAGYRVLEARSGSEALAVADRHLERIDLVVTDVVMPEMGGPELGSALRRRRADLRLLYMSGYTDDAVLRHGLLEGEVAFLQKPITPDLLLRKVRETLDAPAH
jgi:two-component system, cell cycle sensor histidine kinase and response regulator CckA